MKRIPAYLPQGTNTYHKSGTILGVANAAGLIQVEKNSSTGFVAMAVFVDHIERFHENEANAAIARISKIVFDCFKKNKDRLS